MSPLACSLLLLAAAPRGDLADAHANAQLLAGWDPIEVLDPSFAAVVGRGARQLTQVAYLDGARTEGVSWVWAVGALTFTTGNCPTPGGWDATFVVGTRRERPRIATPLLAPSDHSNGQVVDATGRAWVACETTGRRLSRVEVDKLGHFVAKRTLVDSYRGRPLNSPNDAVFHSDGSIWFTDPQYGCIQFPERECVLPANVYRFDPASGELTVVLTGLDKPNGLAFSLDETRMYVADSGAMHATFDPSRPHAVFEFDVAGSGAGARLVNGRLFADIAPGFPDGLRLDNRGNVYVAAGDGVQVFDKSGRLLGKIHTPAYGAEPEGAEPGSAPEPRSAYGQCSNLEFAGELGRPPVPHYERHVLYIASGPAVYAIPLAASHGDGPAGVAAAGAVAAAREAAAGALGGAAAAREGAAAVTGAGDQHQQSKGHAGGREGLSTAQ